MIPSNYIRTLTECYIEATSSSEFWKLSEVIDQLMDYDSDIDENVTGAEFQEMRCIMMKHFKHKEENR